jgi:hypothetical protein
MSTQVPFVLPVNPNDMRAPLTEIRRHIDEMWFAFRDSNEAEDVQEYDLETNRLMFAEAVCQALQSLHLVEDYIEHIREHRRDSEVRTLGRPLTDQERAAI